MQGVLFPAGVKKRRNVTPERGFNGIGEKRKMPECELPLNGDNPSFTPLNHLFTLAVWQRTSVYFPIELSPIGLYSPS